MEENLLLVDEMIKNSKNIPDKLKGYVSAICKGYIRNSNGMISLKGVENVCNAKFIKINENDKEFATEDNYFGSTDTKVLNNGDVSHVMSYVDASNMIKLIMILTHELGHVMTEPKVNRVLENDIFPFMKRTLTYYGKSFYKNGELMSESWKGFRLSDGFLESICVDIFNDKSFRDEIKLVGCDLGNYYYKDSRLFPSRIYDEFRDCFRLFDAILNGSLFYFACMSSDNDSDYLNFISDNNFNNIFPFIDATLESLWMLKKYENIGRDEVFDSLSGIYFENKKKLLMVADILAEDYDRKEQIVKLYDAFADMSKFASTLPFNDEELKAFNFESSTHGSR